MLSLPFVERDSNVGEEPGLEREGAQEQLRGTGGGVQGGMYVIPAIKTLCPKGLGGGYPIFGRNNFPLSVADQDFGAIWNKHITGAPMDSDPPPLSSLQILGRSQRP